MKAFVALAFLLVLLLGCSQQPPKNNPVTNVSPSPLVSPAVPISEETIKEVDNINDELAKIDSDLSALEEIEITELEESTLR